MLAHEDYLDVLKDLAQTRKKLEAMKYPAMLSDAEFKLRCILLSPKSEWSPANHRFVARAMSAGTYWCLLVECDRTNV